MEKYNLEWIKQLIAFDQNLDYLFFWGHTPKNNQKVGTFCLSQWFPSSFVVDGKTYFTAEHWMMAEKARLFNDFEIAEQILCTEKAPLVKELGRKIKNFNDETWKKNRYEIVVKGNYFKFIQNPGLKDFLISTNEKIIVEASPLDNIWGIGIAKDSAGIENPDNWKGLNLLGFALMEARDRIRLVENSFQFSNKRNTVILYRPVGPKELALIKESGWLKFPSRLPEQPIFYPVLNKEYASLIAKDWNVPSSGSGYITKFEINSDYILDFEIHIVGSDNHTELWIPAEELDRFNLNIVGKIEVIEEFQRKT